MGVEQRGKDPHNWTIRYDEPVGPGEPRKRVRVSFRSQATGVRGEREAQAEEDRLAIRTKRGISTGNRGKTSFEAFCNEWLAHRETLIMRVSNEDDEIAPSTHKADAVRVRNDIIPVLGKYKIATIGAREVERAKLYWKTRTRQTRGGGTLAPKTVHNIFTLLRKIMADAVLWKYVEKNPCDGVKIPKKGNRTLVATPVDDARRLVAHDSLSPVHVACFTELFTGMRRGELLAIRREDVDLDQGIVSVTRSLTKHEGVLLVKDIKTGRKGHREKIPLAPILHVLLGAYLERFPGPGPLFVAEGTADRRDVSGRHWDPEAFSSAVRIHMGRLAITTVTPQRLRHAFNSLQGVAGVEMAVRSQMMGHTTEQMTARGYTTIWMAQKRDAVAALERLIQSPVA